MMCYFITTITNICWLYIRIYIYDNQCQANVNFRSSSLYYVRFTQIVELIYY